ncbi:unnamed protein product [marine sediment metagenome]|uniref:Uncharacterized protein n=1 Tax=marine sediment metagenome TaxID=412755 RepID=X0S057_9ZZZZ
MSQLFHNPQVIRLDSSGTPYAAAECNFYLTGSTTKTDSYTDNARAVAHANPVVADSAGQFPVIYLDPAITYRAYITEASGGTLIKDVDPIGTPLTAADILIVDSGAYFAGSQLEAVLADIGANYGKKTAAGTWSADQTFSSATLKMADNVIERAEIKDFSLTHTVVTQTDGTPDFDCAAGNSFRMVLTENAAPTLSNPSPTGKRCSIEIDIVQDGAAGAYTVTWPASVLWPGGTAPTITVSNDAVDKITLSTTDTGTTWLGNFSQAYA